MQGIIEKVGASKKGNPIVTIGGVDYYSKDKSPSLYQGSNVTFEFIPSEYKGKTYNWIVEGTIKPVLAQSPAASSGGSKYSPGNERLKTRSMITSYVCEHLIASGKITADIVAFDVWADHLWNWVSAEDIGEEPE